MKISKYTEQRALEAAKFLIGNKSTVRKTAEYMGYSKSSVHRDLTVVLRDASISLYEQVKKILKYNFDEKYIRGGIATKEKWTERMEVF